MRHRKRGPALHGHLYQVPQLSEGLTSALSNSLMVSLFRLSPLGNTVFCLSIEPEAKLNHTTPMGIDRMHIL